MRRGHGRAGQRGVAAALVRRVDLIAGGRQLNLWTRACEVRESIQLRGRADCDDFTERRGIVHRRADAVIACSGNDDRAARIKSAHGSVEGLDIAARTEAHVHDVHIGALAPGETLDDVGDIAGAPAVEHLDAVQIDARADTDDANGVVHRSDDPGHMAAVTVVVFVAGRVHCGHPALDVRGEIWMRYVDTGIDDGD